MQNATIQLSIISFLPALTGGDVKAEKKRSASNVLTSLAGHATLDPRNVAFGEVRSIVRIAHATYCATQRCWAPHC